MELLSDLTKAPTQIVKGAFDRPLCSGGLQLVEQVLQFLRHPKERLGYPTQKPVAPMKRIISVTSEIGEVVLYPFCGCGTTIHAAEKLGRPVDRNRYNSLAISLIETRLHEAFPDSKFESRVLRKTWVEHGRYSMPTHINISGGPDRESKPSPTDQRKEALTG